MSNTQGIISDLVTFMHSTHGQYAVCDDGEALCRQCVKSHIATITWSVLNRDNTGGWRVIGVETLADEPTTCAHCGGKIDVE